MGWGGRGECALLRSKVSQSSGEVYGTDTNQRQLLPRPQWRVLPPRIRTPRDGRTPELVPSQPAARQAPQRTTFRADFISRLCAVKVMRLSGPTPPMPPSKSVPLAKRRVARLVPDGTRAICQNLSRAAWCHSLTGRHLRARCWHPLFVNPPPYSRPARRRPLPGRRDHESPHVPEPDPPSSLHLLRAQIDS